MHCAVNGPGFAADVFHDVNLTALGPANTGGFEINAEHPKGRPDSLSKWELNARLDFAVSDRKLCQRFQACGGVISGWSLHNPNYQVSLPVQVGIFTVVCVDFNFVVPPATTAQIVVPL